jgi:ankyrin repeat protein
VDIVKLLLKHKANPAVPKTGRSPLHESLIAGHREVAELLITSGVSTDFYAHIALGNATEVRKILTADSSWALRPDGAHRMPLDYAAANGQREIAAMLLAHGAPVIQDKTIREVPPLHYAIRRKDSAMVELLLKAGSSPDTAIGWGEGSYITPALHTAISEKNIELVQLLLAYKADLKVRNTYSQTALHSAAESGQPEIVALLIKAGADVNAPQLGYSLPCGSSADTIPSNNTPLHLAASRGNPAVIRALLDGGAKLESPNANGETPLMATVLFRGHLSFGAPPLENVKALLAAGANINAVNTDGKTMLDMVTQDQHAGEQDEGEQNSKARFAELVALLKKHGAKPSESGPTVKPAAKPRG